MKPFKEEMSLVIPKTFHSSISSNTFLNNKCANKSLVNQQCLAAILSLLSNINYFIFEKLIPHAHCAIKMVPMRPLHKEFFIMISITASLVFHAFSQISLKTLHNHSILSLTPYHKNLIFQQLISHDTPILLNSLGIATLPN